MPSLAVRVYILSYMLNVKVSGPYINRSSFQRLIQHNYVLEKFQEKYGLDRFGQAVYYFRKKVKNSNRNSNNAIFRE